MILLFVLFSLFSISNADTPNCHCGKSQDLVTNDPYKYYFVNATGIEDQRCSSPRHGCHTLKSTVEHVIGTRHHTGPTQLANIYFTAGTFNPETEAFTINTSLTISGSTDASNIQYNDVVFLVSGIADTNSIITVGDFYHLVYVKVSAMTFSVYSTDESNLNISVFSIYDDSKLKLDTVYFNVSADTTVPELTYSLITVNKGTLEVDKTSFDSITLKDVPLISFSTNPDLSQISATFTKISRKSGNGAVFELYYETSEQQKNYNFGSSTFDACSSAGNGGAVFVSINSLYRHGSIDVSRLTFENFGSASKGTYMYVLTNNSEIANVEYWKPLRNYMSGSGGSYSEHNTDAQLNEFMVQLVDKEPVDLYDSRDVTIIEGGDDTQITECGTYETPCRNITQAQDGALNTKVLYVKAGTVGAANKKVTVDSTIVQGQTVSTTPVIKIQPISSFGGTELWEVSSSSINNIAFTFEKNGTTAEWDKDVFTISSAYFTDVTISTTTGEITLKGSLLKSSSGTNKFENVLISGFKLEEKLINVAGVSLTFTSCTFKDMETTTSLYDSTSVTLDSNNAFDTITITPASGKDASLIGITDDIPSLGTGTTFTKIIKKTGNGAVFSVNLTSSTTSTPTSISLPSATYEGCEASAGNGGAIAITLKSPSGEKKTSTLKLRGTYSNCKAASSSAAVYGGAVYIDIKGAEWKVENDAAAGATFTSCTSNGTALDILTAVDNATYPTFDRFNWYFIEKPDYATVNKSATEAVDAYPRAIVVDYRHLADKSKKPLDCTAGSATAIVNCSSLYAALQYVDTTIKLGNPFTNITFHTAETQAELFPYNVTDENEKLNGKRYVSLTINNPVKFLGTSLTGGADAEFVVDGFTNSKSSSGSSSASFVIQSQDYPYVTFEGMKFAINTTKGYGWHARKLFCVENSARLYLNSVTIKSLSKASSSFVSMKSNEDETEVEHTISAPLQTNVIKVSSGALYLTDLTVQDITLNNVPLLDISAQALNQWDDNKPLILEGTNKFSGITRKEGNGAVIEMKITAGQVFKLENLQFENCVAANGNGGAVTFVVNWCGSLYFGSDEAGSNVPSFTSCKAEIANENTADYVAGCGGAAYLVFTGEPRYDGIHISKPSTSGCTAAKYGSDIYVSSGDPFFTNETSYWSALTAGFTEDAPNNNQFIVGETTRTGEVALTQNMEQSKAVYTAPEYWYQKWWVWLIIGVGILLVVALIVVLFVCVCCCCGK